MKKRILIYGAGVIGSTYGGLLARSGHRVTFLARNERLEEIKINGLKIQKTGAKTPLIIPVTVISELVPEDIYDYILVAMRKDNIESVLPFLSRNKSPNIVFMVNNATGYKILTDAIGQERVIPAFPGSGGMIKNNIVHYHIINKFIQYTTIGEIGGQKSDRIIEFKKILQEAGFHVAISRQIDNWQKTHVALVGPLGDAIYYGGGDNYILARNSGAIRQMDLAIRENLNFLCHVGIRINPPKLNVLRIIPLWLLDLVMKIIFKTQWAETVISQHAIKARSEMKLISNEFLQLAKSYGYKLNEFQKLVDKI